MARSARAVRRFHGGPHTLPERWSRKGVWERVFNVLSQDPDNEYAMIDTTIVLSSQHSAGAKGSSKDKEAIGRAKGGLSRKIHVGRVMDWATPQIFI